MIKNFVRIELTFYNVETEESQTFIVSEEEEYIKKRKEYYDMLDSREDFESWRLIENKIVRCDCGRELISNNFTNTCQCGADYNWNGERLADRSQWGFETGENIVDILNTNNDNE